MSSNTSSEDTNSGVVENKFKNDGSFLELFKQMQKNSVNLTTISGNKQIDDNISEDLSQIDDKIDDKSEESTSDEKRRNSGTEVDTKVDTNSSQKKSFLNKRKTKTLKTGIIKKQRNDGSADEEEAEPTDAWNRYMREVRKYKEKYGDDNDKNRPLVK